MTLLPKVKLKAVVNFPATVLDGTGIDVTKSNGTYRFDLAYDDFAPPVSTATDTDHQNILLWNSITRSYTLANALNAIGTRDIISVKSFGAIGNGSADDTAAIQAAINYAGTLIAGGAVYFPAGNYNVTSTLSVTHNGVSLLGASRDSVNLIRSAAFGPLVSFTTATATILDGVGISQLRIVDNGTNNASGVAVLCDNVTRFDASNLTLFGGSSGIVLKAASHAVLNDIEMHMQTPAGAFTGRFGVTVTNTATVGAPVAWGANILLHNVNIYGGDNVAATYANLDAGLLIECVDGIWISNCYFGGAEVADVRITHTNAAFPCGNIYGSNNMMDICRGHGIYINGTQLAKRIIFEGSVSCSGAGVAAKDGVAIAGPTDQMVIKGVVEGWKGNGVHLAATGGMTCTNISVTGSVITANNVGVQILANAGTDRVIVTGNNLTGNTTLAVNDLSSTATAKTLDGNLGYSVPWLTYSPNIAPNAGAITTVSSGRYRQIGSTVDFDVEIGPVTADTGTGYLTVTLPGPPGNPLASFAFPVTENTLNLACIARSTAASNTVVMLKYDGTYPSAVGRRFSLSGTYQV